MYRLQTRNLPKITNTRFFSQTFIRPQVHEVTSNEKFNELIDNKVTIVDFYATWCGPCKAIEPVLDKISEKVPQASFIRVDVDQYTQIAQEYGITAMPTIKFFKDGKDSDTVVGADLKKIIDLIKKYTEVDLMKK